MVVVVEDEEHLLEIIREALASFGYDVRSAAGAREALALCEELGDRVDLVLSDVVMPDLSGPELIRRLEATCPRARFVLMSGYPLHENPQEIAAGAEHGWLQKPFSVSRLIEVVQRAIHGT